MNILAFTFFVFLSTIFWFSLTINKTYVETISFPLKYENFPKKRIQVGELKEKIQLTIETTGVEILKYKIRSTIDPINLDISKCSIFPFSRLDTLKFYVLTSFERQQIASQFKSEVRIMGIKPDTLYFQFDVLKTKKVPIVSKIDIKCKQQYMIVGKPVFEPDSVIISGPATVIDTLNAIYTKQEVIDEIDVPIDESVILQKIQGTDSEKRKIRLLVDVDEYTEKKINVPIIPKNVPDTLKLKTFPNSVSISYNVPFKLIETVSSEDFLMTVNFSNIKLLSSDKLKIELDRQPENIRIMGWEPKNVEFIIEK